MIKEEVKLATYGSSNSCENSQRREKVSGKKIREEKESEKRKHQKKEDQSARKSRKVAKHVVFQCVVAPAGRKVGLLRDQKKSRGCGAKRIWKSKC